MPAGRRKLDCGRFQKPTEMARQGALTLRLQLDVGGAVPGAPVEYLLLV